MVAVRIGNTVAAWSLADFAKYVQFGVVPEEQKADYLRLQSNTPGTAPVAGLRLLWLV